MLAMALEYCRAKFKARVLLLGSIHNETTHRVLYCTSIFQSHVLCLGSHCMSSFHSLLCLSGGVQCQRECGVWVHVRRTHILLTASSHKLRSRLIAKWSSARGGITLSTWQREARTRSPAPR